MGRLYCKLIYHLCFVRIQVLIIQPFSRYILDKRSNLQKPFLHLTRHCAAVLCCRATPLQKAFIVKIVKQQLHIRTLGIGIDSSNYFNKQMLTFCITLGDGANDVSMIQTADVGIGISGAEGRQAVMASDFAIPCFSFLLRLLLVHGHWCYDRLARMVLYFFYKNAVSFIFLNSIIYLLFIYICLLCRISSL